MKVIIGKNQFALRVGDVVHAHGARFKIVAIREYVDTDKERVAAGHDRYTAADAKWIDGRIEQGYFGPEKDWIFQGNSNVRYSVEVDN